MGPGAVIGVKLASQNNRVLSVIGGGSYVFGNPTAASWVEDVYDVPTLIVVYNSGWNAVKTWTLHKHGNGSAAAADVPERTFDPSMDLTHAAHVSEAHTTISTVEELEPKLRRAARVVDDGTTMVADVKIEPI